MITVSNLMDILKDFPGDTPIVIVKDASDNRRDGCYHITEIAEMHSDYEEKQDAIGLSISRDNSIESLSPNFVHTVWKRKEEKEDD